MQIFLRKNKRDKIIVKLMFMGIFLALLIIGKLIGNRLKFDEVEISITLVLILLFYHTINYKWTIGLLITFYMLVPFFSGKGYVAMTIWGEFLGFIQYVIFFHIYIISLKLLNFNRISLNFIIAVTISFFATLIFVYIFNILIGYPVYYKILGFTKKVSISQTKALFSNSPQSLFLGGLDYYIGVFVYTLIINAVKDVVSCIIALLVILSVIKKDKILR